MSSSDASQRVYIGGYDPLRLTSMEILDRLKSTLGDQITLHDVRDGSFYIHLQCSTQDTKVDALKLIEKLYHNTKWKGCKLHVELARPHFLERLRQEIQEREVPTSKTHQSTPEEPTDEKNMQTPPINNIPRHLKVRKGYGHVAHKVDTKPMQVEKDETVKFSKLLRRTKRTRALHMRFLPKEEYLQEELAQWGLINPDLVVDEDASTDKSTTDDDTSTSSTSDDDGSNEHPVHAYQWSSDEHSESSDEESNNMETQKISLFSESHEKIAETTVNTDNKEAYQWSSEEESESSIAGGTRFTQNPNTIQHEGNTNDDAERDLQLDIDRNLNILAHLFPDKESRRLKTEQHENASKASAVKPGAMNMLRFDPTQRNASDFLIKPHAESENRETPMEVDLSSESIVSEEANELPVLTLDPNEDNPLHQQLDPVNATDDAVYEQAKLEDVFREARKAVKPVQEDDKEPTSFSFGFTLESPVASGKSSTAGAGFQFAFQPENEIKKNLAHEKETERKASSIDSATPILTDERPIKRRKWFLTESEISSNAKEFYRIFDGEYIVDDLQRWRNDPGVHEHWMQERKQLTLDWKRKRKCALAKKNKQKINISKRK